MVLVFLALLPWMLIKLVEYSVAIFNLIGQVVR
jgi:flagellar biosynthesis protein FliQ